MTLRRYMGVVLTFLTAAATSVSAQSTFNERVVEELVAVDAATNTAAAIRLDGDLNDAAWLKAPILTAFVQREPNEGATPTFNTEARVVYDQSALYVAVRAYDSEPSKILGFLTRRDVESASDWLHVLIDSYHDRRTAYQFSVNPVGVKRDLYWYNDTNVDDSWDAVWDVVVSRNTDGWQAEFRIPYSQLRFKGSGDGRLGFAVVRDVARLSEKVTWPLLSRNASGWVSSFGDLTGVALPRGSQRLELVPYSVAQVVTEPREAGNPLQKTPDPGASVGLDLKYAVTPALSLTATLNPDFGQVEADPAVVNLSAFETFFAEKRPFFVEGSGTYQFNCGDGCNLFYSRRIGRSPRGSPVLADGEYMSRPTQSTIFGAGKLTGRVGNFSVGVLTAATQEEIAHRAFGSTRRTEIVEPGAFYSVSRAQREFSDQSALGFMVTTTNRRADAASIFPDMALTAGTDYDWRLGQRWGLSGYLAASRVTGGAAAITELQRSNVHSYQRPDAEHVEFDPLAESLNGHAGLVSFGKIAGQRTRMNVNVGYKSPGFDLNEIGFLRRADEIPQSSWFQIKWEEPGKYVRTTRINFNQWSNYNFAGDRLSFGTNFNGHWTFQNLWSTGFGVNVNARNFDDRRTRGGPGAYGNRNINSWQYFNTNNRLKVSFNWNSFFGSSGEGGSNFNVQPGVVFRPVSAFSAELTFLYESNTNDAQWVTAVTTADRTHYVFGRLDQSTTSITTRLNYTLTPTLSVQLYGQPFVSAGRYEHYKELVDGRAERYRDRYAPFAYERNADFNVLSFRTTNVLRWEFKPGSALFVVWQQGREGFTQRGNFRFGRDFGDVFSTPSTNTLLVKLAYWINP